MKTKILANFHICICVCLSNYLNETIWKSTLWRVIKDTLLCEISFKKYEWVYELFKKSQDLFDV